MSRPLQFLCDKYLGFYTLFRKLKHIKRGTESNLRNLDEDSCNYLKTKIPILSRVKYIDDSHKERNSFTLKIKILFVFYKKKRMIKKIFDSVHISILRV